MRNITLILIAVTLVIWLVAYLLHRKVESLEKKGDAYHAWKWYKKEHPAYIIAILLTAISFAFIFYDLSLIYLQPYK